LGKKQKSSSKLELNIGTTQNNYLHLVRTSGYFLYEMKKIFAFLLKYAIIGKMPDRGKVWNLSRVGNKKNRSTKPITNLLENHLKPP
jgi:hypothetical protein